MSKLIDEEGTKEMKNYGCDLVTSKDLKSTTLKTIRRMKMVQPIKVQIRQNGMTSKGRKLCCHMNVEWLVKNYGGQRLLGYMISYNDDREIMLITHSVWITPEGKIADVTQRGDKLTENNPSPDKSIQFFIPISTNGNITVPCILLSSSNRKLPSTWVEKLNNTFGNENDLQLKQNPTLKRLIHKYKSFHSYYQMSEKYFTNYKWFEGVS